jgi:hypothetical protein
LHEAMEPWQQYSSCCRSNLTKTSRTSRPRPRELPCLFPSTCHNNNATGPAVRPQCLRPHNVARWQPSCITAATRRPILYPSGVPGQIWLLTWRWLLASCPTWLLASLRELYECVPAPPQERCELDPKSGATDVAHSRKSRDTKE